MLVVPGPDLYGMRSDVCLGGGPGPCWILGPIGLLAGHRARTGTAQDRSRDRMLSPSRLWLLRRPAGWPDQRMHITDGGLLGGAAMTKSAVLGSRLHPDYACYPWPEPLRNEFRYQPRTLSRSMLDSRSNRSLAGHRARTGTAQDRSLDRMLSRSRLWLLRRPAGWPDQSQAAYRRRIVGRSSYDEIVLASSPSGSCLLSLALTSMLCCPMSASEVVQVHVGFSVQSVLGWPSSENRYCTGSLS